MKLMAGQDMDYRKVSKPVHFLLSFSGKRGQSPGSINTAWLPGLVLVFLLRTKQREMDRRGPAFTLGFIFVKAVQLPQPASPIRDSLRPLFLREKLSTHRK